MLPKPNNFIAGREKDSTPSPLYCCDVVDDFVPVSMVILGTSHNDLVGRLKNEVSKKYVGKF